MKKILLSLVAAFICINPVFADFKYTEETKTETQMPQMFGMFQNMAQNNSANTREVKTVFIKNSKLRVDFNNKNVSLITRCDKRQIIALDHRKRVYNVKSIDDDLLAIKGACSGIGEANKQIKAQQRQTKQISDAPLIIKTVITDTKQNEMIGAYRARKYIRENIISGNPSCIPNMHTTEYVWTAPIKSECFNCPVYTSLKGCKSNFIPGKIPDCFKKAKYVKVGLAEVPGFVLKTQIVMDMSKMMGSMQGMSGIETGRASAVDVINSGFDIFGRALDLKTQVNDSSDQNDQDYQQENRQNYPQQRYNQYQPAQNYNQYQPQPNYNQHQQNYNPDNENQPAMPMDPGGFKMTSTTTTIRTNISYNLLPNSLFEIPQGYKLSRFIDPSELQSESGIYESTCNSTTRK